MANAIKFSLSQYRPWLLGLAIFALIACGRNSNADKDWTRFCLVDPSDSSRSLARLSDPLVTAALEKMDALPEAAQVLIPSQLRQSYRFARSSSRQFLDALCGEYRDDSKRLEAKLRLFSNMVVVPESQLQRYDPSQDLMRQLTADGIRNLILISHNLRKFRNADSSPAAPKEAAVSVCEFKFLLANYLSRYRTVLTFEDRVSYDRDLAAYLKDAVASGLCSPDDLRYFFAFRGSGYISPADPESAAMKQVGAALRSGCGDPEQNDRWFSAASEICDKYQNSPHGLRREITAQLLRRLVIASGLDLETLAHKYWPLVLTEDSNGDGTGEAIIARSTDDVTVAAARSFGGKLYSAFIGASSGLNISNKAPDPRKVAVDRFTKLWKGFDDKDFTLVTAGDWRADLAGSPDFGLGQLNDIATAAGRSRIRRRIELILNRHAFYYQTYLFFGTFGRLFPSVTPFLSTSADFAQAAKFSFGGFAVGKIKSSRLGWIFVFKIDGSRLFNGATTKSGRRIDWMHDWLDESTLASHALAVEESGLDRFSEPAPEEFNYLLYLGDCVAPPEILVLAQSVGDGPSKEDEAVVSDD